MLEFPTYLSFAKVSPRLFAAVGMVFGTELKLPNQAISVGRPSENDNELGYQGIVLDGFFCFLDVIIGHQTISLKRKK